ATTYVGSSSTTSSAANTELIDTKSPTPAPTTPCSSPASITRSSTPAWPNSPNPAPAYTPPSPRSTRPSANSPATQTSPPDRASINRETQKGPNDQPNLTHLAGFARSRPLAGPVPPTQPTGQRQPPRAFYSAQREVAGCWMTWGLRMLESINGRRT